MRTETVTHTRLPDYASNQAAALVAMTASRDAYRAAFHQAVTALRTVTLERDRLEASYGDALNEIRRLRSQRAEERAA